jgi:hypothetical protein
MNFFLRFLLAVSLVSGSAFAQLSEDFTAPDFTITDTDGNEHNLYAILDEGKSVILNLFASRSSICWNLFASGVFRDFNDLYGSEGDHSAFVISVESDLDSPLSHLSGGGSSEGNWASIIDYPVAEDEDASILAAYGGWPESILNPAVFIICPDKSFTEIGQGPTNVWGDFWDLEALTEKINNCPSVSVGLNDSEDLPDNKFSIFPNPASSHTTLELSLEEPDDVVIDVVNTLGQQVFVQKLKMNTGINTVEIPVETLTTGMYYVSIRIANEVHVDKLNIIK